MTPGERLLAGDGWCVPVTSWPRPGKSTSAATLDLSLLAKDEIKKAVIDAFGERPDPPHRRRPAGCADDR